MDATDDMAPTLDVHPELSFQVLGPVRVVDRSGDPLPLGPPRRRTLLGALLVHPRVALPVDRLTDLVWDGTAPPTAATMVHGAVAGLRRVLEAGSRAMRRLATLTCFPDGASFRDARPRPG
jgi:DNA-binding SARP family transcriptional activator